MKIALDAMGGSNAPKMVIEGALEAVRDFGFEIILVGRDETIKKGLSAYESIPEGITIRNASQTIEMHEAATTSVRSKKDSSISVAMDILRSGAADAVVSAGNTGAAVCAATLMLKTLGRVERPGIAVILPALGGNALLIDAGANIDPKPLHLLQYGIMGEVYSRYVLRRNTPKVGLLNIGEEETKGTDFIREVFSLMKNSRLNFIGNLEGKDVFMGKADVIVCDGFVGNVVLKVSESLGEAIVSLLHRSFTATMMTRIGAYLARSAFSSLKRQMDYAEYGGALLLGINGSCVIAHGSSSGRAIKNAIKVAGDSVGHHINEHIVESIGNSA